MCLLPGVLQPVSAMGLLVSERARFPGLPCLPPGWSESSSTAGAQMLGWPSSTLRQMLFFTWWCFEDPQTIPEVSVSHLTLIPNRFTLPSRALVKGHTLC